MFFISLTKDGVARNFSSEKIEEIPVHSWKATIVTDKFLSEYVPEKNGFSLIESPFISSPGPRSVIFSKITIDTSKDTLSIYKSTISGRPIYYHMNPNGEFFCSTHISLLRAAGVQIEENRDVLPEFFVYRFVMPPNTLYKNIYKVLSGGQLLVQFTNTANTIKSHSHYTLPGEDTHITSISSSSQKLYTILTDSLKKLNECRKETSVLLSGGLDSSVLSAICKDHSITNTSYSTGYPFEDPEYNNERQYAITAAQALEMDHYYYEPTTYDYLRGVLESIFAAEEPLHHLQSVLLHLLFSNEIPSEKRIVVLGQGAGTTFGSNHSLYMHDKLLYQLMSTRTSLAMLKILSKILHRGTNFIADLSNPVNKDRLDDPQNHIWSWMDYGNKKWVCEYFHLPEKDIITERYRLIKEFEPLSINDIWALYSFFGDEQVTLSIWTKIAEADQKILYTPYYDQAVLDYVFSIPWKLRLHRPDSILRKELARQAHIPPFIIHRSKLGFGVSSEHWGKKDGVFESLVPLASKVFERKQIRDMQSSKIKNAMTYWNILNYALWKRLCIDHEPLETLLEELNTTLQEP